MSNTKHTCTCQKCQNEINGLRKRVKKLERKFNKVSREGLSNYKNDLWLKARKCFCQGNENIKQKISNLNFCIQQKEQNIACNSFEYCHTNDAKYRFDYKNFPIQRIINITGEAVNFINPSKIPYTLKTNQNFNKNIFEYHLCDLELHDLKQKQENCKNNHRECSICFKKIYKESLICTQSDHEKCIHKKIENKNMINIDHILPIGLGGTSELSNLQLTHTFCNNIKGGRCLHPDEYLDARILDKNDLLDRIYNEASKYKRDKIQKDIIIIQCKICFSILGNSFIYKNINKFSN